jgi:hypothetical protein
LKAFGIQWCPIFTDTLKWIRERERERERERTEIYGNRSGNVNGDLDIKPEK